MHYTGLQCYTGLYLSGRVVLRSLGLRFSCCAVTLFIVSVSSIFQFCLFCTLYFFPLNLSLSSFFTHSISLSPSSLYIPYTHIQSLLTSFLTFSALTYMLSIRHKTKPFENCTFIKNVIYVIYIKKKLPYYPAYKCLRL